MGSFSRTQSPVLTMQPSAAHQTPFDMPMFPHQNSPLRAEPFAVPSAWSQASAPAMLKKTGRKRSRDEAAVNLDVEAAKLETIEPVKEPEDEWVYGEGMVLIKKSSAYVADAGTQSGTWLEERAAEEEARKIEDARAIHGQHRPSMRSNKSQRLDLSSVSMSTNSTPATRSSPVRDITDAIITPGFPADTRHQPVIDQFTLHLGIGWKRISDDEHIQAAARGWARYIENHFPITKVQIQLESKGLQSYLVKAAEGIFLFAEDLRRGQLVSRNMSRAFENLKVSPPAFEGAEVLTAATTPQPSLENAPSMMVAAQDVDMDMS
ncbi:uncharacterized protein BCR38DRAFT_343616 [Pseudomassariella vexata]|uniref:Uncharacterized protein n=1 Tax=Pseudomassariella vexata TaxID=1141098 RepID=A0A1Y2DXQ0_9PEZI|nr:uncharacterized protein BCR38DRAFT_343616 [Pseudomassariella vexata]ORY63969.1 hypothetical protein BCR38DRAFT_343616 [Pseudomassariella vexata]